MSLLLASFRLGFLLQSNHCGAVIIHQEHISPVIVLDHQYRAFTMPCKPYHARISIRSMSAVAMIAHHLSYTAPMPIHGIWTVVEKWYFLGAASMPLYVGLPDAPFGLPQLIFFSV